MSRHEAPEEEIETRLPRDEIRFRSGHISIVAPIGDVSEDGMSHEVVRFVDRMNHMLGASDMQRSWFFVWDYSTVLGNGDPVLTAVFWDEIESIRPVFVNERGGIVR